jgi:hypothetical protein
MKKLLKALYMLSTVILSTVGIGHSAGALTMQNANPLVIKENTPLYLEHVSAINQSNVQIADHESHYSHQSHESHYSHRSHYSGY